MGRGEFTGWLDKDPAAILIPIERTAEGEFVTLVRQFRYTVEGTYFELPQGGVGGGGGRQGRDGAGVSCEKRRGCERGA